MSDLRGLAAQEQPGPTGTGPVVLDDLLRHVDIDADTARALRARSEIGVGRYGTALRAHNGRDSLRDFREELLDAAVYAWQARMEGRRMDSDTRAVLEALLDVVDAWDGGEW